MQVCLDDWLYENNPVRVIEAFVDMLDLAELGLAGVGPADTGWAAYHPCGAFLRLLQRPAFYDAA